MDIEGLCQKEKFLEDPLARKIWHTKWNRIGRGKSETLPDVALYFTAQIATVDKNKIRAVWGYPIDVMVEGRFFYPYLKWTKEADNLPIAHQVEMATGGMQYIDQMTRRQRM
jgi:hypothetical protein